MGSSFSPYPSPDTHSPHMPVWVPSQFDAVKQRARRFDDTDDCSLGEIIANSVSNGVAAALAVAALVIIAVAAVLHGGGVRLLAGLAFAVPMLLAFLMSTLYHALPGDTPKQVFRVLGHDFVFLYIAGAFTPYCALVLAGTSGYALCAFEWTLAVVGILVESVWRSRPRWVPLAFCVAMLLAAMPFAPALMAVLPAAGWWLLVAAGACFAAGLAFYCFRKLPYFWFVSHLVVLAGSVCLFLSAVLFVI